MSDGLNRAIGRRIRSLRKERHISQEELADRAKLHRNYVGSVERGERDVGVGAMARLAAGLGLSLAAFFSPFKRQRR